GNVVAGWVEQFSRSCWSCGHYGLPDAGGRGIGDGRFGSFVEEEQPALGLRKARPESLVGKEKEGAVLPEGAAESTAKIILAGGRFGKGRIVKPVAGIEDVVAEVIENGAMPLIGAALGDNRDLRARSASEFRRIG